MEIIKLLMVGLVLLLFIGCSSPIITPNSDVPKTTLAPESAAPAIDVYGYFCPLTPESVQQHCNLNIKLKPYDYGCGVATERGSPLILFFSEDLFGRLSIWEQYGLTKPQGIANYLDDKNEESKHNHGPDFYSPFGGCSVGVVPRFKINGLGDEVLIESVPINDRCVQNLPELDKESYEFYVRVGRAIGHFRVYGLSDDYGCTPKEVTKLVRDTTLGKLTELDEKLR